MLLFLLARTTFCLEVSSNERLINLDESRPASVGVNEMLSNKEME